MKRIFSFLLLLTLLILPVYATENNDFFNEHANECVYDGRDYLVNDSLGYLCVLDAPGGQIQHYLFNEQTVTVFAVYTDSTGVSWAQLRYSELSHGFVLSGINEQYIGWAPLDSLYREMDMEDFLNCYEDSFVNRPLRLRLAEYPDTTLWTYPGAEKLNGYLRWYVHDSDALLSFPAWWKDGEGKRWALWEDSFLCLDEPERTEGAKLDRPAVFYPAISSDALPFVAEPSEREKSPSPLPYVFLGAAAVLLLMSYVIRKITNIERK